MKTFFSIISVVILGGSILACTPPVGGGGGDNTAPGDVSMLEVISLNQSLVLSWSEPADEDFSHVELHYGTNPEALELWEGTIDPDGTVIDGLENDVLHTFEIISFDTNGNASVGVTITGTPTSLADTTPTGPVLNLVAEAGDAQVTLSWIEPQDPDFNTVEIYYGLGTITETRFEGTIDPDGTIITGLANGIIHAFRVVAIDYAENVSVAVTVQALPLDPSVLSPPSFSGLAQTPTNENVLIDIEGEENATIFYSVNSAAEQEYIGTLAFALSGDYSILARQVLGAQESPYSVPFQFTIDKVAPAEVSDFSAEGEDSSITLSWVAPGDVDLAGYKLFYGTDGNPSNLYTGTLDPNGTTISGLTNALAYTFLLVTVDELGNESDGVTIVESPVAGLDETAPSEVSQLNAIAGNAQVTLTWTAPDDSDLAGYLIQYGSGGGADTSFDGETNAEGTIISGLTNGVEYTFQVQTYDEVPNISQGVSVTATPAAVVDESAPGEVTNLEALVGDGQITLSWLDPSDDDLVGYNVFYGTDGSADLEFAGFKSASGTVINGLTNGTEYTFLVQTYDEVPNTSVGVGINAVPLSNDTTAPGEITNLSIIAGNGNVTLTWSEPTDEDLEGYLLWYGTSGNTDTHFDGFIDPSGTVISGLTNGIEYTFLIQSFDEVPNVSTGISGMATPEDTQDTTPPGEVSSLAALSGDSQVTLSWVAPIDDDLVGYRVFYGIAVASTEFTGTKNPAGTLITGLTNGEEYTFLIRTYDEVPNTSTGVSTTATPADTTPPAEVIGLSAVAGDTQVTLSWTPPSDSDLAGYEVLYGIGGSADTAWSGSIDPSGTIITGLTNDTEYTFAVRAFDEVPNYSGSATTTSTPNAASNGDVTISITIQNPQEPSLSWTITGNISGTPEGDDLASTQGGGTFNASVSPDSGTISSYSWRINGLEQGTGSNITLNPDDFSTGPQNISLFFTIDGSTYSQSVTITIQN